MQAVWRRQVFGVAVVLALLGLAKPFAQPIIQPDLKTISPVFDGWLKNSDGTVTLFFGYFNRNPREIPIGVGPNNRVEPAPEDRDQPTNFLPQRQRHVFHVTVPENWNGELTWTVEVPGTGHREQTTGSLKQIYQIENPSGAKAPSLRDLPSGSVMARTGEPLTLTGSVSAADTERGELSVQWSTHRGPTTSRVEFSTPASVATTATFSEPGTYVLRLRVEERVNMGGSSEEHHADALVTVTVSP